jgi:hypothetical protein
VWNKSSAKKFKIIRKVFQGEQKEPLTEVIKDFTFADVLEMEIDLVRPKMEGQVCRVEIQIVPQEKSAFQRPLKAVAACAIPPSM